MRKIRGDPWRARKKREKDKDRIARQRSEKQGDKCALSRLGNAGLSSTASRAMDIAVEDDEDDEEHGEVMGRGETSTSMSRSHPRPNISRSFSYVTPASLPPRQVQQPRLIFSIQFFLLCQFSYPPELFSPILSVHPGLEQRSLK